MDATLLYLGRKTIFSSQIKQIEVKLIAIDTEFNSISTLFHFSRNLPLKIRFGLPGTAPTPKIKLIPVFF